MLRFPEDHLKIVHLNIFRLALKEKSYILLFYELGKDGGDPLIRLCLLVNFFTLT